MICVGNLRCLFEIVMLVHGYEQDKVGKILLRSVLYQWIVVMWTEWKLLKVGPVADCYRQPDKVLVQENCCTPDILSVLNEVAAPCNYWAANWRKVLHQIITEQLIICHCWGPAPYNYWAVNWRKALHRIITEQWIEGMSCTT